MRRFYFEIAFGTTSDKDRAKLDRREKALNIGVVIIVIIGAYFTLGAL